MASSTSKCRGCLNKVNSFCYVCGDVTTDVAKSISLKVNIIMRLGSKLTDFQHLATACQRDFFLITSPEVVDNE